MSKASKISGAAIKKAMSKPREVNLLFDGTPSETKIWLEPRLDKQCASQHFKQETSYYKHFL